MVQLQVISKILESKDYSIITDNLLTVDSFTGYEEEFNFLKEHYEKYKNVPDKLTFLEKFPDFEVVDVQESDSYLVDKIREEQLFKESVPILQKAAELYKEDANAALEYVLNNFKNLKPTYNTQGIDIIQSANDRYEKYVAKKNDQGSFYFSTGFKELDEITHGIQRGEEFIVIFARINQGKSWILEKMAVSVWEQGHNVGFISPEMSATSIGYRFDTLHKNYSNHDLTWGNDTDSNYKDYLNSLTKNKNKLLVATPSDFGKKVTVSKIRNWILQNNLDMIAIDGLTYLTDERAVRGDNKTTSLTNISEDLMSLSVELQIPILSVVQANRSGVQEEDSGTPELETIRDSDGMGMNASKVFSIRQKYGILEIGIKKQRTGRVGDTLKYNWNIDKGEFLWIPDESLNVTNTEEQIKENRDMYNDTAIVF